MAFDAFLHFPGSTLIRGETLDEEMAAKGAFQITGFDFAATNTSVIDSQSGGGGKGKTDFENLTFNKITDTASAGLYRACAVGLSIPDAVIECRRHGQTNVKDGRNFFIVSFKQVIITEMKWTGDEDMTESLSMAYGAKKIEYRRQDKDGVMHKPGSGQSQAEWSKVLNKESFKVV